MLEIEFANLPLQIVWKNVFNLCITGIITSRWFWLYPRFQVTPNEKVKRKKRNIKHHQLKCVLLPGQSGYPNRSGEGFHPACRSNAGFHTRSRWTTLAWHSACENSNFPSNGCPVWAIRYLGFTAQPCNHNVSLRLSVAFSGMAWWTRTTVNDFNDFQSALGKWLALHGSANCFSSSVRVCQNQSYPRKGYPMLASGTAAIMVNEQTPFERWKGRWGIPPESRHECLSENELYYMLVWRNVWTKNCVSTCEIRTALSCNSLSWIDMH